MSEPTDRAEHPTLEQLLSGESDAPVAFFLADGSLDDAHEVSRDEFRAWLEAPAADAERTE